MVEGNNSESPARVQAGDEGAKHNLQEEAVREANQVALTTVYQEICKSYHAIDDFRAKLLGLLPLASGTGIFLLLDAGFFDQATVLLLPIGLFGLGVTLGLFAYELRGIQRCLVLIEDGAKMETTTLRAGHHFARNPDPLPVPVPRWLPKSLRGRIENTRIGAATAARVVYPTVLAAWLFVALLGLIRIIFALTGSDEPTDRGVVFAGMVLLASVVALGSFLVGFRVSGSYIDKARKEPKASVNSS